MQADEREAFDAFARGRMRALLRFAHVLTGDPHRAPTWSRTRSSGP